MNSAPKCHHLLNFMSFQTIVCNTKMGFLPLKRVNPGSFLTKTITNVLYLK